MKVVDWAANSTLQKFYYKAVCVILITAGLFSILRNCLQGFNGQLSSPFFFRQLTSYRGFCLQYVLIATSFVDIEVALPRLLHWC